MTLLDSSIHGIRTAHVASGQDLAKSRHPGASMSGCSKARRSKAGRSKRRLLAKLALSSTVFGGMLGGVLATACSSDDSGKQGGATAGSSPILGTGTGTIFGGDDPTGSAGGAGVVSGGSFDSCAGEEAGTELSPAVLELLVDTSLSMDERAPGSRNSKWVDTRSVLLSGIDQMPATTAMGVVFYPDEEVGAATCFDRQADVAVGLLQSSGSMQRSTIGSAFARESPRGSTPTHDAYRYALDELSKVTLPGDKYLVLITDGTPTYALGCQGSGTPQDPADPTPLIPEAASALGRGMKTFVIGSPGSEDARTSLSQMAQAGGTARPGCSHDGKPYYCHFDMTQEMDFAKALRDAFASISGLALSCAYDIPEPPNNGTLDPNKVNVYFTPTGGMREIIGQSPAGACKEGWQYSPDQTQLRLCGDTCDRIRSASGQLSLEFGCETRIIF